MTETKQIIKDTLFRTLRPYACLELITDEACDKLNFLYERLIQTNANINITAITDPYGVSIRHFADSITLCRKLPLFADVVDVGCGGGFPCLPLAIVRSDLCFLALDSTSKKLGFVEEAAKELSLNITTLSARAEDASRLEKYREKYDVAVSRAVARLNILSELCIPFVKPGGIFIAMKGSGAEVEMLEAKSGIEKAGGKIETVERFVLGDAGERALIICRKTKATPDNLPRPFAKIKKKPLG